MKPEYVIFGFSHFFGDIFDCIDSTGGVLKAIFLNVEEKKISGRETLQERLSRLPYRVEKRHIEDSPWYGAGYRYVIGFSGKQMVPLLSQLERHKIQFHPLVHARAILQSGAFLHDGVIVDAGAVVGPWADVGKHTILNRSSSVGHDCRIGAYSFLGPSATLCSHVRLGSNVKVGANATVLPDVQVGPDAVIAAGAVVTKDVPAGVIVAGVPAVVKKPRRE